MFGSVIRFWLCIIIFAIKKTEVMFQPEKKSPASLHEIQIDRGLLNNIDSFTYLDSTLSSSISIDRYIQTYR